MYNFEKLLNIAQRKLKIDKSHNWSKGSSTYLNEILNEIEEVNEELEKDRLCYLEDELADVLWDYMNILVNLKDERNVSIKSIISRAIIKYEERISGLENGIEWSKIKVKQQNKLEIEHISK